MSKTQALVAVVGSRGRAVIGQISGCDEFSMLSFLWLYEQAAWLHSGLGTLYCDASSNVTSGAVTSSLQWTCLAYIH